VFVFCIQIVSFAVCYCLWHAITRIAFCYGCWICYDEWSDYYSDDTGKCLFELLQLNVHLFLMLIFSEPINCLCAIAHYVYLYCKCGNSVCKVYLMNIEKLLLVCKFSELHKTVMITVCIWLQSVTVHCFCYCSHLTCGFSIYTEQPKIELFARSSHELAGSFCNISRFYYLCMTYHILYFSYFVKMILHLLTICPSNILQRPFSCLFGL